MKKVKAAGQTGMDWWGWPFLPRAVSCARVSIASSLGFIRIGAGGFAWSASGSLGCQCTPVGSALSVRPLSRPEKSTNPKFSLQAACFVSQD